MDRNYGKSLACQKFTKTLEGQIRNYWQIQTSLIYAERWWNTIEPENLPQTIAKFPNDSKRPFTSIDISPKDYIENFDNVEKLNRENTFVNFITAFEVYLFDIIKRIFYMNPELVGNSTMPMEAGVIGLELSKGDIRDWFSQKLADKYLRNLTHLKMLHKIQGLLKCDFETTNKKQVEEWNKWTYVRNAIIHNGREVSEDLNRVWKERFPIVGEPLNLTDKDMIVTHSLALELVKIIDKNALKHYIRIDDASLLIREFFVQFGIDDRSDLSQKMFKILSLKMKPQEIDSVLAFQRRTSAEIKGWKFSKYNFS
jgi:hypothetical protein